MSEKKVELTEAVTGEAVEVTESQLAAVLGLDRSDGDYDPIMRDFFGFEEES